MCKPSQDHCCVNCPPEAQVVPGCWAIKIQQLPASHHSLGSGIPGSAVHPQRVNPASITILVMGRKAWAEWWIFLCLLFFICKMGIKPSLGMIVRINNVMCVRHWVYRLAHSEPWNTHDFWNLTIPRWVKRRRGYKMNSAWWSGRNLLSSIFLLSSLQ